MRRNRLWIGPLSWLIMLSIICGACGKRDDPMPPKLMLPVIADLGVRSLPDGIGLGWSLGSSPEAVGGFKIFRSETADTSRACPGCPQEYRPYGILAIADDRLKREGERRFRYVDTDVRAGGFYSYRIAVCSPVGLCGEASNESGVIHTGR